MNRQKWTYLFLSALLIRTTTAQNLPLADLLNLSKANTSQIDSFLAKKGYEKKSADSGVGYS